MVSSEAVPFSKSGGLADVVSSLSQALTALGHDVRLVLPAYGITDNTEFIRLPNPATITMRDSTESVRYSTMEYHQVPVYLVNHPYFNDRKGIYGDTSYAPYPDNLVRYTLFSQSALQLCRELDWYPDILHCHDWTVGFLPLLAKQDPAFSQSKSVFTIHNLAYQGDFPRMDVLSTGIPVDEALFQGSSIHKRANMLKAGLEFSDVITTVSPTYATEIQGEAQGCGLESLLQRRSAVLSGILNGIDTDQWNPSSDPLLDIHFSREDLAPKAQLKQMMQKRFRLPVDSSVPVIGMISRIADQKGFVELCQGTPCALEQILTDFPVRPLQNFTIIFR